MCYVIQNFLIINKTINFTPRFKTLLYLINIHKLFIFFKINNLIKFFNQYLSNSNINFFIVHFRYLYLHNITKIYKKLNLFFISDYSNNHIKSLLYYNLSCWNKFLLKSYKKNYLIELKQKNTFNLYFLPVKVVNFKINKKFYENFFFFFLHIKTNLWFAYFNFFKFQTNFMLIMPYAKLYYFYNNFFFNIYNI